MNTGEMLPQIRKVSVVVPSYNHARYVTQALDSVAQQTYRDYEVIVLDDASADESAEKIEEFIRCHPEMQIRFLRHAQNKGGVLTLNELIENARGEYIALNNSDDIWLPDKLEQQVEYLDHHPEVGAVFTQAEIVNDDGRVITSQEDFTADIFMQQNRTRGRWLRRLFYEQNCLCHPSILIRRAVYDQIGLYDPRFRQLPDMQMWVRLIKQTDIRIIEQPLVRLRYHLSNTSRSGLENSLRISNELSQILDSFFDGAPDEIIIEGFADLFQHPGASTPEEVACETAFLYQTEDFISKPVYYRARMQQFFRLLGRPETRDVLASQYGFDYGQFFAMSRPDVYEGEQEAALGSLGLLGFLRKMLLRDRHYAAIYLMLRYPNFYRRLLKVWMMRNKART